MVEIYECPRQLKVAKEAAENGDTQLAIESYISVLDSFEREAQRGFPIHEWDGNGWDEANKGLRSFPEGVDYLNKKLMNSYEEITKFRSSDRAVVDEVVKELLTFPEGVDCILEKGKECDKYTVISRAANGQFSSEETQKIYDWLKGESISRESYGNHDSTHSKLAERVGDFETAIRWSAREGLYTHAINLAIENDLKEMLPEIEVELSAGRNISLADAGKAYLELGMLDQALESLNKADSFDLDAQNLLTDIISTDFPEKKNENLVKRIKGNLSFGKGVNPHFEEAIEYAKKLGDGEIVKDLKEWEKSYVGLPRVSCGEALCATSRSSLKEEFKKEMERNRERFEIARTSKAFRDDIIEKLETRYGCKGK